MFNRENENRLSINQNIDLLMFTLTIQSVTYK